MRFGRCLTASVAGLAAAAGGGGILGDAYRAPELFIRAGWLGNDIVALLVLVPALAWSALAAQRRWLALVRLGALSGKMVFEVRPDIAWDKGRAVMWLMDAMGVSDAMPAFVGDDVTDADGFDAVWGRGARVFGSQQPRPRRAEFHVASPDDVRRCLAALARAA